MIRVLGLALLGRLADVDHLDTLLTDAVTIGARRRHLPVALDGEVTLLETPLTIRIRRGALRVCVPEPSTCHTAAVDRGPSTVPRPSVDG